MPFKAFILFFKLFVQYTRAYTTTTASKFTFLKLKILVYFTVTQYWRTLMPKITISTKHPQGKRYFTLVNVKVTLVIIKPVYKFETLIRLINLCSTLIYSKYIK